MIVECVLLGGNQKKKGLEDPPPSLEGPSQKIKLLSNLISWFLSLQIGLTKIYTKGFDQILLRTLPNGEKN